jgi:NTP pyrophosphatase (non-canonical NTP hydrolase)
MEQTKMALLDFNTYQKICFGTAKYNDKKIPGHVYCTMKLTGEAGEFSEKMGKIYRDKDGVISLEDKEALVKELGDVMWYVANLAGLLGYKMEDVAQMNIDKLLSRVERGVIHGSGDNR